MAYSNTFSGARAIFFVGTKRVGFASGVSGEENVN